MRRYIITSIWVFVLALMLTPIIAAYGSTITLLALCGWLLIRWEKTYPPRRLLLLTRLRRAALHRQLIRGRWTCAILIHPGQFSWRATDGDSWSAAAINLPMREAAQIWVTDGGRAEIQFDDGSYLRLGNGSIAVLKTLYSDQDGEFTEINLTEGLCTLNLRHLGSVYQVDTPFATYQVEWLFEDAGGSGQYRRDRPSLRQRDRRGRFRSVALRAGDYLDLTDTSSAYTVGLRFPSRIPGTHGIMSATLHLAIRIALSICRPMSGS